MLPYGRQSIYNDDIQAVIDVLKSDWITTGPKIREFEEALCRYTDSRHSVVVNSGTSALDIAIQSLSLPRGSEAVTTPFTFAATANCLVYNGVRPVFADIDPRTYNLDPQSVKTKITDKTRAIVYVDFAGQPCDIHALQQIADEHDLFLVEDACHALGAEYKRTKVGTLADLTAFSFHPVKHITTGEGGAVTLSDKKLYKRLLLARSHGIDRDAKSRYGPDSFWAYDMKCLGRNYRMTDIQAALGISQLKKLDKFINQRTRLARQYFSFLANNKYITLPELLNNVKHAWHIFCVILNPPVMRDDLFSFMRARGIGVNVHYIPIYSHSFYQKHYPVKPEDFPNTEDVFSRIITLPLYPGMTDADLESVVMTIQEYCQSL